MVFSSSSPSPVRGLGGSPHLRSSQRLPGRPTSIQRDGVGGEATEETLPQRQPSFLRAILAPPLSSGPLSILPHSFLWPITGLPPQSLVCLAPHPSPPSTDVGAAKQGPTLDSFCQIPQNM